MRCASPEATGQLLVEGWQRSTPPGFVFAAKLPQSITHEKRLVGAEEELRRFVDVMARLDEKLGPLLIQLPPSFEASERPALATFLANRPEGVRFACELRHRSWLTDATFDLLSDYHVAWVLVDSANMPLVPQATSDFVYIRWLGTRKVAEMRQVVVDRTAELQQWRDRITEATAQGHRVYGYFNNHYSGHSPATCRQLQGLLGLEDDRFARVQDEQPTLDLGLE